MRGMQDVRSYAPDEQRQPGLLPRQLPRAERDGPWGADHLGGGRTRLIDAEVALVADDDHVRSRSRQVRSKVVDVSTDTAAIRRYGRGVEEDSHAAPPSPRTARRDRMATHEPLGSPLVGINVTTALLVIVPAWNEEEPLPRIPDELSAQVPDADILVVNDGSTDDTARVVRESGHAMLLDLPLNLGVGGAMRAGYRFALRQGYQRAVQVDADGQHDPADVARVVGLLDEGANVAVEARFTGEGDCEARGPRRWAMSLLSAVLSRIAKVRLTDTTSGFRACDRRGIVLFATEYPAEYLGEAIESVVIASRAGLTIRQVGVQMRPRSAGTPSQSPLKAAAFLGRAVLALLITVSRPMSTAANGDSR